MEVIDDDLIKFLLDLTTNFILGIWNYFAVAKIQLNLIAFWFMITKMM
jgi:hypothetical protein